MVLRIKKESENRIFKVYLLLMFALMVVRYLLKIDVPAAAFLLVAMLPIWLGSVSEQLAFVASCIPLSVAFQYKYAYLMLAVAMLVKNRWRLKTAWALALIFAMMLWELCHAFYQPFSYVEYLRDFAELILLGVILSVRTEDLDHRLILRSLAVSVVGVCVIMLVMQLQQFDFDFAAVFLRSARSFRFGQGNMKDGTYALNFNANNLGFICNLSTCGMLLLATRKEQNWLDITLAVSGVIFALMTMSRAAIVCAVLIFAVFLISAEGKLKRKLWAGAGGIGIVVLALLLIHIFAPTVFENIAERFQRKDVWNGRGGLLKYYNAFLMSSPVRLLFGVGMQEIFKKVSPFYPVHDVPHMGLQEVWVAWGPAGIVLISVLVWQILDRSGKYAQGKRRLYQFMPLALTLIFTMSGQFLTSSRALMALIIAYVSLSICVQRPEAAEEK